MTERPILFSGAMVRALLAGTKTQTRRVVKPARKQGWLTPDLLQAAPNAFEAWADTSSFGAQFEHPRGGPLTFVACPYGGRGGRLWVKETWTEHERFSDISRIVYAASKADALAEGIIEYEADSDPEGDPAEFAWDDERGRGEVWNNAKSAYLDLWRHINGRESLDANPWVWAVSFEVAW